MEVTGEAEAQESPAAEMTKANSKRPSARRGEKAGLHLWPQHRHRSTGLIGDSAASLSISPLYLPEQPHVTCANFSVLTAREKIDIENEWYQTDVIKTHPDILCGFHVFMWNIWNVWKPHMMKSCDCSLHVKCSIYMTKIYYIFHIWHVVSHMILHNWSLFHVKIL